MTNGARTGMMESTFIVGVKVRFEVFPRILVLSPQNDKLRSKVGIEFHGYGIMMK